MTGRNRTGLIQASALLAAALFALQMWSCGAKAPEKKTEIIRSIPVKVQVLKPESIEEVYSYTGNIQPYRELKVFPDIAGKIARIYVEEGDFVKKGQPIALLDTTALHLQEEQAAAALAVAKANYEDAKRNYERMLDLKKKGSVSDQQFDKVELAFKAAKARLEQAQAALHLVNHNLSVAVMRAPFSGFVGGRFINEGETINPMMPGGFGVVTLVDLSKVKVVVNVPEKEFYKIRPGMPARIYVDPFPNQVFEGKVVFKNPVADVTSRSFRVQIVAPNPGFKLKPGMFARADIVVSRKEGVPVVPLDVLIQEGGKYYAFRVKNGRADRTEVVSGISDGLRTEVVSGLAIGDTVVVQGERNLREGDFVRIVPR